MGLLFVPLNLLTNHRLPSVRSSAGGTQSVNQWKATMEDEGYFLKDWNKAAYRIPPFSLSRHFTATRLALELDLTKAVLGPTKLLESSPQAQRHPPETHFTASSLSCALSSRDFILPPSELVHSLFLNLASLLCFPFHCTCPSVDPGLVVEGGVVNRSIASLTHKLALVRSKVPRDQIY